jgi:hypothetical protein
VYHAGQIKQAPARVPLFDQVNLVLTDVLPVELFGGLAEVAGEGCHVTQVALDGPR